MLSIKDLYNISIKYEPDSSNAKYVRVMNIQKINPNLYRFITYTSMPNHKKKHICIIGDLGKNQFKDINSNVFVSCDCGRFKFKWEYALCKHGASAIRFSNGQAAKKTNPHNYPCCCKHILRSLHELLIRNK